MNDLLLVIDEGTTSTRAMLFDREGACRGTAQRTLTQQYPRPGWVEHDAAEIWSLTLAVARDMVDQAGGASRIAAIGITNQRETIAFWDKRSGEPLAPAIVWQDRRTADACRALREAGHEADLQACTGLLLDPYFSASKIGWALDHWPQLNAAGDRLAIGTIDSWLIWKLTGGLHVTDATNASRTALMAIGGSAGWDDALIDLFGVPRAALPEIVDSAGMIGETRLFGAPIPICGIAGDQQVRGDRARLPDARGDQGDVRHRRVRPHPCRRGTARLATPPAGDDRVADRWPHRTYALEGSVFVAGSLVQWLRDTLGLIGTAAETEALAREVSDTGGVYLVPALSGLGAPWWEAEARGSITGLSFATSRAHIVRAALEAMAYQAHDLKTAFAADGADWAGLRIDGGMVANDWIAQDMADVLDLAVDRPRFRRRPHSARRCSPASVAGCSPRSRRRARCAARWIGSNRTCRTRSATIASPDGDVR